MKWAPLAACVVLIGTLPGCGNTCIGCGCPTATPSKDLQVVAVTEAPAAAVEQTDTLGFTPQNVTVHVGERVRWTNSGSTPHNVTFDSGPTSSTMNGGDEFEVRFTKAGTYPYVCTFHAPGMAGTVHVTP